MASSPINWYLAVLSVSDTFILISSFFVLTLPRLGEFMTWWRANFIRYTCPLVSPILAILVFFYWNFQFGSSFSQSLVTFTLFVIFDRRFRLENTGKHKPLRIRKNLLKSLKRCFRVFYSYKI